MNPRKKAIEKLTREIDAGQKIIAKEKKALKKTKSKLGKSNKKQELKVIEKSVEAMEDYKEAVKNGAAPAVAP